MSHLNDYLKSKKNLRIAFVLKTIAIFFILLPVPVIAFFPTFIGSYIVFMLGVILLFVGYWYFIQFKKYMNDENR